MDGREYGSAHAKALFRWENTKFRQVLAGNSK
jgi:hypothetical protein